MGISLRKNVVQDIGDINSLKKLHEDATIREISLDKFKLRFLVDENWSKIENSNEAYLEKIYLDLNKQTIEVIIKPEISHLLTKNDQVKDKDEFNNNKISNFEADLITNQFILKINDPESINEEINLENEDRKFVYGNEELIKRGQISDLDTENKDNNDCTRKEHLNCCEFVENKLKLEIENFESKVSFENNLEYESDEIRDTNETTEIAEFKMITEFVKKIISSSLEKIEYKVQESVEEWRSIIDSLRQNIHLNSFALSKRRDQFASINELITHLSEYKFQNDLEKAWLIYVWVTDNIEYNLDGYVKGDYGENDAGNVLRNGKSVCSGYSNLFEELCQRLGIECRSMMGYSKAFSYKLGEKILKPNHEWNVIKINDKWCNVEPTWGAGYGDWATNTFVKRFEPFWFLTPDELFIYKHFSFEKSSLGNKIGPLHLEQFEQMPCLHLDFHLHGLSIDSPHSMRINCVIISNENPLVIEIDAPKQTLLMGCLKEFQDDKNLVLIERDSHSLKYRVICFLPESLHQYELQLYAKSVLDYPKKDTFDCVAQYLVESTSGIKYDFKLSGYGLEFKYGLRCLSHFSRVICSDSSLVEIEFLGDRNISLLGKLKEKSGLIIENRILIQETLDKENNVEKKLFKVKLILPDNNFLYNFELFATDSQNNVKYEWAGEFLLNRNNSEGKNQTKFVKTYSISLDSFIYSPIEYDLNKGQMYTFKYYIKNALQVALVDANNKWNYLEQIEAENDVWSKEMGLDTCGDLCLYVKYGEESDFDGFCSYEVF